MSSDFDIHHHTIDGQHIRQYRQASAEPTVPLKICINQYVPKCNRAPKPGDITIIATHAVGFTKELYEPYFSSLLAQSKTPSRDGGPFRIRAIWIADIAHMGYSSTANAGNLGNAPHFFDHARDLLHMINTFREQMPPPLVGLGHSVGTAQLVFLSNMHPALFAALALVETVISDLPVAQAEAFYRGVTFKPDFWSNRADAEASIRRSRFFKHWDPRVVDRVCQHGLKETPDLLFPDKGVTLRTSKHQESFFLTPSPWRIGAANAQAFRLLPYVRPPVLFVQGLQSNLMDPGTSQRQLQVTGTAVEVGHGPDAVTDEGEGGNGGVAAGNVEEVKIDAGHFLPFERVEETAKAVSDFFARRLATWRKDDEEWSREWHKRSTREKQVMSDEWIAFASGKPRKKEDRNEKSNL